jgi:hypothetical protein
VLLIALWVRSYGWSDIGRGNLSEKVVILLHSASGQLSFSCRRDDNSNWKWESQPAKDYARLKEKVMQMDNDAAMSLVAVVLGIIIGTS